MLKCVIYRVTSCCYEILSDTIEIMKDSMSAVPVILWMEDAAKKKFGPDYFQKLPYDKDEILFVTDSPSVIAELFAAGCYAIAFYHETNREAVFPGARYAVEKVEELIPASYEKAYRRLAGLPWDILETERLKVRESTLADVEEFYRIYATPSITDYMEDLFQDKDMERAYMESYIKNVYGFYGFGLWTVILKQENWVIGRAGLSVREGYDLPELGFVIDAAYQKRGYGYEVCKAILYYAKEELNFDKVQAMVKEENAVSLKLLHRLGFQIQTKVKERGVEYVWEIINLHGKI